MPATYDKIATQTVTGSAATTVTFSSIPATYTDLVIIWNGSNAGGSGQNTHINFNSDTASNYSRTYLLGDGSSAASGRNSNQTEYQPAGLYPDSSFIINIFNYANTTTFKTVMTRSNVPSVYTVATVGLWRKTPEAIHTVAIGTAGVNNLSIGSTFTLYGIKAA